MTLDYLREHITEYIDPLEYFNTHVVTSVATKKKGVRPLSNGVQSSICPFHHDTDPSFNWWSKKKRFHCFGKCGTSWDVIQLHQKSRQEFHSDWLGDNEALVSLLKLYGLQGLIDEGAEALSVEKTAIEKYNELVNVNRYNVPKGVMTFGTFQKMNNSVIAETRHAEDLTSCINRFVELDMVAGLLNNELIYNA